MTAGTAALVTAGFAFVVAAPSASAVTQTATTKAQLATLLGDGTTDTVVLGNSIAISDGSHLVVSSSLAKTLDLNGQSLSISSVSAGAAIDVSGTASLAIQDSVGGGVLSATGGPSGAGIGGSSTSAGAIEVVSGTVTATGGTNGAGIGGGNTGAGGTVTVFGGTVTATGGTNGAGIGGGNAGAGGAVAVSGPVNPVSVGLTANGGSGAAGIGGGNSGAGGSLTMTGGGARANGGSQGAGVGGGSGGAGATVNISGGTLFATGGSQGAGIGGGNNGAGGALSIGSSGAVLADDGHDGQSSAVGAGAGTAVFGSLSNSGALTIATGATMHLPAGYSAQNNGTLINKGTLTSDASSGVLVNDGTILNSGSIQNNGDGGASALTVSHHNYAIAFDVNGGPSSTPAGLRVYADTISLGSQNLPTVSPPSGGIFLGWYTAPVGGTQVLNTTSLATVAATGPSSTTLYAHYRLPQTITFPAIGDQTFGAADFAVSASASSGLPVSLSASPASVCTISGATIHIVGAGSCNIAADQSGNAAFLPAPEVVRSFQVRTGVLTVTATGTQVYRESATFTPSVSLPANVTLSGSLTCTGLSGGVGIGPALATGVYTIDPNTCGGIVLSGSAASNFHLAFGGGAYTVTKANVNVTAMGDQTFGGSPTFAPIVSLPPNTTLNGSLTCTTVNGGTPIDSSLAVGSYSTDPTSCGGLSLGGNEAGGYQIVYQPGTFAVSPKPVTVTATGNEAYGTAPAFAPVATMPSGIALSGALTCTRLTGNIPITSTMAPGTAYTIDHTSCSGLSLSGSGTSNYQLVYANGPFTVTKAHVAITTHTDSFTSASKAHKFTFTTTVMNADAHVPIVGVKVTVTVKFSAFSSASCSALTNASGVAVCTNGNGNLYLQPGRPYTATTAATPNYFAGSGTGAIGS